MLNPSHIYRVSQYMMQGNEKRLHGDSHTTSLLCIHASSMSKCLYLLYYTDVLCRYSLFVMKAYFFCGLFFLFTAFTADFEELFVVFGEIQPV